MLSAEEIVLLCCLAERDAAQQDRLLSLAYDRTFDWSHVWDAAAWNQVLPLVAKTLLSSQISAALSPSVVQDARSVRLRTIFANMSAQNDLTRIARRMSGCGINCVALKGVALAERLFDGLDSRQLGDIDLLVPQSAREAARAVLVQMGYAPAVGAGRESEEHPFHGVPFISSGPTVGFAVELHWLLNDPRYVSIDYQQLWPRVLSAGNPEQTPLQLPREELLLFLALHHAHHSTGVLRLLVDIDRLVRREGMIVDWPYALELAERWQVSAFLYFALHHAQELLATPVQPWIIGQLKPAAWRRAVVNVLVRPRSILRPSAEGPIHPNRFKMAYPAMLGTLGRSLDGYRHYLYQRLYGERNYLEWKPLGNTVRLTHRLVWMGRGFASCLANRLREKSL